MNFSFTSLGCASALPTVNRFPSAHVLKVRERLFLIDCGEGCQMQLRRYGFSFLKIREIFISHTHGDHIFGIYGLLSTMSMIGRSSDLFIYAPSTFGEILSSLLKHFGGGFNFKVVHIVVKGDEPEKIIDSKSLEVLSFPLKHRGECYGYLFREKMPLKNVFKELVAKNDLTLFEIARLKEGLDVVRESGEVLKNSEFTYLPYLPRSFAYCSDTAPFETLSSYIEGVSLLYHETTFASDLGKLAAQTMHSTASDAAICAKNSNAGKLLIGHFSTRYHDLSIFLNEAREIFSDCEIAEAGKEFIVPLIKP
ncbi:MAG: ribonuclease Z [Bacteroidales bacterium]|jgi:ribonuclease Z|nr:ribonuclease Z [Bacteroidales bacterium]